MKGSKFLTHLFRIFLFFLASILIFIPVAGAIAAQQNQPDGPYYVVQPGDALWDIAARFKVSLDDLERANEISDPGQLKVGAQLVIPGLDGIQGQVDTRTVAFGETLSSLMDKLNKGRTIGKWRSANLLLRTKNNGC
jgi:LysM repeat protein